MSTFGIDLGTTNSVISMLSEGRPMPVEVGGSAIVPSVVCFRDDGSIVVGREARNLELAFPERTVRSAKRRIGQDFTYDVAGRRVRPEEVSAEVLRALKAGAEAVTGQIVREVVITVPAYFDDAQRRATLRAGELAGLDVLRLLNEPTSAALVFDQVISAAGPDPEIVMVYDLGGGTFDVSVLEVFGGVREVRSTAGNTHLGGDDFDDKLVSFFLDLLRTRNGAEVRDDPRAMARLRRVAESTKIHLSADTEAAIAEEFIATSANRPVHLQTKVTRRQLEDLIRPLLESTVELARRVVADANLGSQALARVCLVGGSTRIPLCRELLEGAFGVDVREDVDPDLAVGLGAAVQAGLLKGEPIERVLVDVSAHSLGIRAMGRHDHEDDDGDYVADTFVPIIRRNTVLPATRSEELYTAFDDQELIQVEVFQGELPHASKNTAVGTFKYELEPVPESSPVRFQLEYDLNGVVRVSVSQPGTKNAKTVALQVADSGHKQSDAAERESSAIARKARAALPRLDGERRTRLEALLAQLTSSQGEARTEIEDAILDVLLDADGDEAAPSR
jgi:molecular chaperone DnaK